ncbi:division/cell wall cluster transcriptional repressor MraZ [Membranihabitans marinus]|uniref:division/cell wall cluster transcriptional repressor MraZ n=1 Tax=Membranihabitans marinus TaxID=1227546 RepID=UPI001F0315FA|nr:division/cell wall cluster transcriptional repressor MraZ [Membranihabitans marinus]
MVQLYGEYECKIDAKGRLKMPAQLLKQLGGLSPATFFVNRGFENCIMLYPEKVWDKIVAGVNKLNVYRQKDRNFIRYFYRGVTSMTTDSADRVLISKHLLDYANIEKEVVLFAYLDRIEMWDKDSYYNMLDAEPHEFSDLAEQVLGQSLGGENQES